MTTELGPSARALLDAARPAMSPDAAAIKRMRAKVDATVAGGTAATITAATITTATITTATITTATITTATITATTITTVKLGMIALACAVAIAIGVYANRTRTADAPPRIDLPSTRSEPSAPTVVRPAAEPPAIEMDAMPVARPHMAASHIEPHPVAAARAPIQRIALAREVDLIDQAMTALRGNDPAAALASLHTHATETRGDGQLAEDAAAIEIEALCRLHDPLVPSRLEAFDARFPRSAQRSRLTSSCQ